MDAKRSSRMSVIPQLRVPEIFVDDEDEQSQSKPVQQAGPSRPQLTVTTTSPTGERRSAWASDLPSPRDGDHSHPLSVPRSDKSGISPPGTPSAFSFELQRADGQSSPSGEMARRGSAVSPSQARDMLDDSVWVQSIRKSKTIRKSDRTTYRYGDIG